MYRVEKRKKGKVFFLLLFLCAFAIGLGIGYGAVKIRPKQSEQVAPQGEKLTFSTAAPSPAAERPASLPVTIEEEEPPEAEHFFVAVRQGDVCVFTVEPNGDLRFSHKPAIELDALPQTDRAMLTEGVYLNSRDDLLAFCEDFAS